MSDGSDIFVTEVTDRQGLDALQLDWERLTANMPEATPFQSWEWNSAWWRHQGRGALWVLVARRQGVVAGIFPLVITRYRGTPLRQVRFLAAPLSDYQNTISAPADAIACVNVFVHYLFAHSSRWELCDLNDLIETHPLVTLSQQQLSWGTVVFHRRCPAISLPDRWDVYRQTLGKNLRANIGRRRRQLENHAGAQFLLVQDAQELEVAMEALYHLHNRRWRKRGVGGAFASTSVRQFHHEVARTFLKRGWLRLYVLRQASGVIAAFYCFSLAGRVYYYLSGFDLALGRFSPGMTLMAFAIEKAIAEKATTFDLLRGDEDYKYEWQASDQITRRVILRHSGLFSWIAFCLHAIERRIEHWGLAVQRRMWGRTEAKRARKSDSGRIQSPTSKRFDEPKDRS